MCHKVAVFPRRRLIYPSSLPQCVAACRPANRPWTSAIASAAPLCARSTPPKRALAAITVAFADPGSTPAFATLNTLGRGANLATISASSSRAALSRPAGFLFRRAAGNPYDRRAPPHCFTRSKISVRRIAMSRSSRWKDGRSLILARRRCSCQHVVTSDEPIA